MLHLLVGGVAQDAHVQRAAWRVRRAAGTDRHCCGELSRVTIDARDSCGLPMTRGGDALTDVQLQAYDRAMAEMTCGSRAHLETVTDRPVCRSTVAWRGTMSKHVIM